MVVIRMVARHWWDEDFEVVVPLEVPARSQSVHKLMVRMNRLLDPGHRFRGDVE